MARKSYKYAFLFFLMTCSFMQKSQGMQIYDAISKADINNAHSLYFVGVAAIFFMATKAVYKYLDDKLSKNILKQINPDQIKIRLFDSETDTLAFNELFSTMFTGNPLQEKGAEILIAYYYNVLTQRNILIGFIVYKTKNKTARIDFLGVSENYRKLGCATRLVRATNELLEKRGMQKLKANVRHSNNIMQLFALKLGLKKSKEDHFIQYEKVLD